MKFKCIIITSLLIAGLQVQGWSTEITQKAEPTNTAVENYDPSVPKVFGGWMFKGDFAKESFSGFNPNYEISIGNRVNVQLWGGYEYQGVLEVDPQGNVFIPKVGPVKLLGVRNSELNRRLEEHVKKVYSKSVGVYATLDAAQPVKVYVTGFVKKPGLYAGLSSDSVLYYLDKAGGITPRSGSYIDITLLRNGKVFRSINLYDFLLLGQLPAMQMVDGDIVQVNHRMRWAAVSGLVQNEYEFEFGDESILLSKLLADAKVQPTATHVRVSRNQGSERRTEYYPLRRIADVKVQGGDQVEVTADKKLATISVRVEGEHDSAQEYVLPYGATFGELMDRIQHNRRSNSGSVQLFRKSIQERQKLMLESSLQALESSLLTARSATNEEAKLRTQEAELILQWVERARSIEPSGQVVLADAETSRQIVLEPGDVIRVPRKTNLVMIHGEVLSPNAVTYSRNRSVEDYIKQAGGFKQDDGNNKILLLHSNGSFSSVAQKKLRKTVLALGDEIMVMPRIDTKSLQVTKDITEVMYQIAVSAGVLLAI